MSSVFESWCCRKKSEKYITGIRFFFYVQKYNCLIVGAVNCICREKQHSVIIQLIQYMTYSMLCPYKACYCAVLYDSAQWWQPRLAEIFVGEAILSVNPQKMGISYKCSDSKKRSTRKRVYHVHSNKLEENIQPQLWF